MRTSGGGVKGVSPDNHVGSPPHPLWKAEHRVGWWYTVRQDRPHELLAILRRNERHAKLTAQALNLLDIQEEDRSAA